MRYAAWTASLLLALVPLSGPGAHAQDYPSRVVTIIVPFGGIL